jgi:hypothetical protein
MGTKIENIRSLTWVSDPSGEGILLSIVDENGAHKWQRASNNQAALSLSELAKHVAKSVRDPYPPEVA